MCSVGKQITIVNHNNLLQAKYLLRNTLNSRLLRIYQFKKKLSYFTGLSLRFQVAGQIQQVGGESNG